MKHRIVIIMLCLLAAGCDEQRWQTKDVSGLLPKLHFRLSGLDGKSLTADELRGDHVLLFFGFTSCADVCPTTLKRLATLTDRLPEPQRRRTRVLFVSVDPARDDPERLAAYVQHFGEAFMAATGTQNQLREMARRYRTTFSYGEPDANGYYDVSHSSGVYVFDDKGEARLLFRPGDSLQAMRTDLAQLMQ